MFSLANLKFKMKFGVLIAVAVLGFAVFGALAFTTLQTVKINGPLYAELSLMQKAAADFTPPSQFVLGLRQRVGDMNDSRDKATVEANLSKFKEEAKQFEEDHAYYEKSLPAGPIKDASTRVYETGSAYVTAVEKEFIPLKLAGKDHEASQARLKIAPLFHAHEQAVVDFTKLIDPEVSRREQDAKSIVASRTTIMVFMAVVAPLIVVLFAFIMSRRIVVAIQETLEVLQAMAKGDMTRRLATQSKDELGDMARAMNEAMESVSQAIRSIEQNAQTVASASEELSASATQQSEGAGRQKDQAHQVATAMQEMASTVLEVSQNSNRAADAARKATDTAKEGGQIVQDAVSRMRAIADAVRSTAAKIQELGKSSDQIGHIIGVIDDIADQTNLLALNAAIEAARAGEQGRGFAVVADEVRKLAERTTQATKEIAAMIQTVQQETRSSVAAMQEGTKQVEAGVEKTTQAGSALEQIIGMADQVGEMTTHIATAATEQSSATEQVNASVDQIAKLVQESADGAQQSAKACQDLSNLALDLQNLVSRFKVGEQQSTPQPRRPQLVKAEHSSSRLAAKVG